MIFTWAMFVAAALACGAVNAAKDGAVQPALSNEEEIWLDKHNMARARYNRAPLIWDDRLEKDAQRWADHMARNQEFEHSDASHGQGENLWMGTRDAYPADAMVQSWIDEERYMKSGTFPDVSTTGNWADVGHMTQLIWPSTAHVGCAKASSAADDYFVCRYSPPGNWLGEVFDARQK